LEKCISTIFNTRLQYVLSLYPNVAKVEDTAGPRHQGRSCSRLPQGLDNAGDAVSSAFLKGKQHSKKGVFIGWHQRLGLMMVNSINAKPLFEPFNV
jgi:hypothetical protein